MAGGKRGPPAPGEGMADRAGQTKAARFEVSPVHVAPPVRMDKALLASAVRHLQACDPQLKVVLERIDVGALSAKLLAPAQSPFRALCRIIVYQQLAGSAAATIWARFEALLPTADEEGLTSDPLTPKAVRALSDEALRGCGLSGRKASYISGVADAFLDGTLGAEMEGLEDEELAAALRSIRGLGEWSVHMFMIFTLKRPDVLPVGDLGVRKGVEILYGKGRAVRAGANSSGTARRKDSPSKTKRSPTKRSPTSKNSLPSPSQMEAMCAHWRPYRSVGACIMWHVADTQVDM